MEAFQRIQLFLQLAFVIVEMDGLEPTVKLFLPALLAVQDFNVRMVVPQQNKRHRILAIVAASMGLQVLIVKPHKLVHLDLMDSYARMEVSQLIQPKPTLAFAIA